MPFWRREVIQPALDQDVERALAEQQAILQRNSRSAGAHFALGTLTYFRGNRKAALDHFYQAIELDPAYAAPHISLGRALAVEGRYEEAWSHAREAGRLGDPSLLEQLRRHLPPSSSSDL